jgi:hypothetical protein
MFGEINISNTQFSPARQLYNERCTMAIFFRRGLAYGIGSYSKTHESFDRRMGLNEYRLIMPGGL